VILKAPLALSHAAYAGMARIAALIDNRS